MKKLIYLTFGLIFTMMSCQKDPIQPNPTPGNTGATVELTITKLSGIQSASLIEFYYYDITGTERYESFGGYNDLEYNGTLVTVDSIDWSMSMSVNAKSGYWLYGSSGAQFHTELSVYNLNKDGTTVDNITEYNYFYQN